MSIKKRAKEWIQHYGCYCKSGVDIITDLIAEVERLEKDRDMWIEHHVTVLRERDGLQAELSRYKSGVEVEGTLTTFPSWSKIEFAGNNEIPKLRGLDVMRVKVLVMKEDV